MDIYECKGTYIFMRWKMKCSIQRGEAELNDTFHFLPNENMCSIARMNMFYITFLQAAYSTLRGKYYADACVMLNARTASVAFAPRRVSHVAYSSY